MSSVEFPTGIADTDKSEYRCLQLVTMIFTAFISCCGYSRPETLNLFVQHGIYDFIRENYDFYHTVGKVYIVEDICECFALPKRESGFVGRNKFEVIIDRKTNQVIYEIAKRFNMQYSVAFNSFCSSETYGKLANKETEYWRESVPYILESYISEKSNLPANDDY